MSRDCFVASSLLVFLLCFGLSLSLLRSSAFISLLRNTLNALITCGSVANVYSSFISIQIIRKCPRAMYSLWFHDIMRIFLVSYFLGILSQKYPSNSKTSKAEGKTQSAYHSHIHEYKLSVTIWPYQRQPKSMRFSLIAAMSAVRVYIIIPFGCSIHLARLHSPSSPLRPSHLFILHTHFFVACLF